MNRPTFVFLTLLLAGRAFAGETPKEIIEPAAPRLKSGYEINADYSYVGSGRNEIGKGRSGNLDEQDATLRLIWTPQWDQGPIYRFGFGFQRYAFGLPSHAQIPNTIQSVSVIVGLDFALGDSWLMRVEAEPGFYAGSSAIDSDDFNVPFIIGGSYIASASVQWIFGLSVDLNREYPVIPALGVRWNFSGPWTINATLPTPRLEYAYSKALTLFAGADFRAATYRLSRDFGDKHGEPKLNSAYLEYDEVRVGAGLSWKPMPTISLEAQAGYLPYREFNYHRAGIGLQSKEGAAYGQLGLSAKF